MELQEEIAELRSMYAEIGMRLTELGKKVDPPSRLKKAKLDDIKVFLEDVRDQTGVDFAIKGRGMHPVIIRQIVMYILYTNFSGSLTLQRIGNILGKKDHSTVLSSVNKVKDMIKTNDGYYLNVLSIVTPIFFKHFENING